MNAAIVGPICLGALIGWVTHRTLYKKGERVAVSALVSVGAAIGGAAISGLLGGEKFFAWYSIGLAGGFFLRLYLGQSIPSADVWLAKGDQIVVIESTYSDVRNISSKEARKIIESLLTRMRARGGRKSDTETAEHGIKLGGETAAKSEGRRKKKGPSEEELLLAGSIQSTVKRSRYANAALFDPTTGRTLRPRFPLQPSQLVRLRLDIGALSSESQVTPSSPGQQIPPFPDKKLPADVDLGVMVSSTDFVVGLDAKKIADERATIAHGKFFLPGDGGPATAAGGAHFLDFFLRTPTFPGKARSRIGYYYKNILVQSQLLAADVGEQGGFEIKTDFTLSDDLTNLSGFPQRPRISVLTNANGDGTHQIVLRKPGTKPGDGAQGESFSVAGDKVGKIINDMRSALRDRSPSRRHRRRVELQEDLAQFAPKGWSLFKQVPGQHPNMFQPVLQDPASYVVQVLRPTTSGFAFPWSLIYDIPLDSKKPDVCKLITDWDETKPLVSASMRECPHGKHVRDVLCPFGFWGFRYSIDQLSSTKNSVFTIPAPDKWNFVVAETQNVRDIEALSDHVKELQKTINKGFPNAKVLEGKDKAKIHEILGSDLPVVYFYCHGEKIYDTNPDTYLGVGKNESITADEVVSWVQSWAIEKKVVWDKIRPLVFVNACHSLEIHPETLVSYLGAFVGSANAAGVIGTEVRVDQVLAMKIAERFFDLLLGQPQPVDVDQALRTVRLEYLADGNLVGLLYTSYCWAELTVTRQPAVVAQN